MSIAYIMCPLYGSVAISRVSVVIHGFSVGV